MPLRSVIPSMFHRRLLLLLGLVVVCIGVLLGQAYRLAVVAHADMLREAESRLINESWTPTVRGRILDRKGRVLAKDEASYDVLVDYRVITEEWVYSQAARLARRNHSGAWPTLDTAAREQLISKELPAFTEQLRAMWTELALALGTTTEELEARRAEIRETVQASAATVWARWLEERREELARERETQAEVELADVAKPLGVQREAHLVAQGLSDRAAFEVRRLATIYPGLRVEQGGRRAYPLQTLDVVVDPSSFPAPARPAVVGGTGGAEGSAAGQGGGTVAPIHVRVQGVATHILGWMRELQREDLDRRRRENPSTGDIDPAGYFTGDLVGGQGAEAAFEPILRGSRGRIVEHLDTGTTEVIEPSPGRDVALTIDAHLQARVQAVMDPAVGLAVVQPWQASTSETQLQTLPIGTALHGAAVVLDVDSAEVLALVTTPSFTREQLADNPDSVWKDPLNLPWVNRAIGKPYPPGSIVKPLILSAAVSAGVFALDRAVDCTGHLYPEKPEQFRCWVFKQFGRTHNDYLGRGLVADEAIAVSCNIFFYTLGRELGPERIGQWYRAFGVGEAPAWGLGPEFAGTAGARERPLEVGEATLMGIGQGPIAWTPLHAASAYATLARGGVHIKPRLSRDERPVARDLKLDPRAVDAAMHGLHRSANDTQLGTGEHLSYPPATGLAQEKIFNLPGVSVWGKTGTAEAPAIMIDPDGAGPLGRQVARDGDHSWFVVLAGPENKPPRYAIAVIMEYAGSGARVSGPIANQVLHALRAEGYL